MLNLKAAITIALLASSPALAAGDETWRLSGRAVTISGPANEQVLKVDGREMHQNAYLSIDEITVIDGTLVAIGSSSAGGNACDSSYFFLSFPKDGAAKFDGPIESCFSTSYEIGGPEITVATANLPGHGQQRWQWTATRGIQALEKVAFSADAKGWEVLRERQLDHPGKVLSNGAISAELKTMIGADYDAFQRTLNGVGSGEFLNDDWFGESCRPHMCSDEEAILYLSGQDRKIYAAWKPSGEKIRVWPVVTEWPEKAKVHLRGWADKWK